jgi:hypothetical protein
MSRQLDTALGNAAEVRNGDGSAHDARDCVHEPFGLTKWQMKNLPNQKGCFNGVVGISQGTPARSSFDGVPLVDRFRGKPDRDVTTPTQSRVVVRSVGHLVFWLGELVTATFAIFVRHELSSKIQLPRIMPVRQNGG